MSIDFQNPRSLSPKALEEGSDFAPHFDAAGLVTVITVEASSGAVLMLAYMNAEALQKTLETGEAHYYSRSRRMLWKKGETSGEVQKLVEMRVDCDQDAILLLVKQTGRGAACHTGRKTCFYRKVAVTGGRVSLAATGERLLFDPADIYGNPQ